MKSFSSTLLCVILFLLTTTPAVTQNYVFPVEQPADANVNKPYEGARITVSPPGFCWWRVAKSDDVTYKLFVYDDKGKEFFISENINECAYIPSVVFSEGNYSWIVKAYNRSGNQVAERKRANFSIVTGAYPLPKPDAMNLIKNVPATHPRLIFTREGLPQLCKDVEGVFKEQYSQIIAKADKGLTTPIAKNPSFHLIDDDKANYNQKRTEYQTDFRHYRETYLEVVEPLAFAYMVTADKKYGDAVKKHLLRITEFPIEQGGPIVVFEPKFDEVALQIADALPRAYDWAYDAFTPAERIKMEEWIMAMGDSLLVRLSSAKRDFLFYSGESHDGRIPPYLINFALCMANHPERAAKWLDFAITASLTVYPQWASEDGGWAEGVSYAITYSERFIPPIDALYRMTGLNLWERPFYKNFPYFLTYCISPVGEVSPFGDSEEYGVKGARAATINSMLRFYAERNNDPYMRWWVNLFKYDKDDVDRSMKGLIQDIMLYDNVKPRQPENIAQERIFMGLGWAAIHADILDPENELFLLFKSSPFGPESHSHLDQNSFVIMKGGKALAIPAGARYPQHGSSFHTRYTRLTTAHNTLLFNNKGQVDKEPTFNARIFSGDATKNISYVAGEGHKAYGRGTKRFDRHIVMLRPSVILLIDDLDLGAPGEVDWLLHGKEEFILDEKAQTLISNRMNETMRVEFIAPLPLKFSQDDIWPIEPKMGFPMVTAAEPEKQFHFTGKLAGKVEKIRIAAVMTVGTDTKTIIQQYPSKDGADITIVFADKSYAMVKMLTGTQDKLMEIVYTPKSGPVEKMIIKSK